MNLADGYVVIVKAAIEGSRPDPELRCDEWAEEFMILPKSGPQPGPFRFDRSYPARRVHQVLSPSHPCKRVVAKVASQMFKTQTALNWIGSLVHRRPRNILALEPTDTLVKRFSARVSTMIRNVPVLRERVSASKSRDSRNTTQAKDFQGDATLYMNTAGSAANLAEVSAPYIYVDEIDRLDLNVDGEGDPVELAEARATQYANDCKFFYTSSPGIEGFSKIDTLYEMGTQEKYFVPCPHCDHLHSLELENFRYARDEETGFMDRAWFVCPECWCEIEERHKITMLPDEAAGGTARWVATAKGDGETVSFTCSAFYMPVGAITWLSLARQYARAKDRLKRGDHEAMQVFYNTRLGLSYKNSEASTTAEQLRRRAEDYPLRVVPDEALVVTMTTDTQPTRLECQIEAWGPGLQHWVIDYIVLTGSPAESPETPGSVWQRLDQLRLTPLMHASGRPIMMSAYGIDSAGHNTQDVYNYGQSRKRLNCVILHGSSRPNRPIMGSTPSKVDIDWGGQKIKGGVELWTVGTDVAKDWLNNRMHLTEGEGAMRFSKDLPPEWFDQMVVEQPRTTYRKGKPVREWIKPNGARNEAWDVSVYNLALAHQLGLHRWSRLDWKRLRDKLIPPVRDLFAPVLPPPADPSPAPVVAPTVELPAPPAAPAEPEMAPPAPQPTPTADPEPAAQTVQASVPPPEQPSAEAPAPAPVVAPAPTAAQQLAPVPLATALKRAPVGRRILSRGIR
ncbi:phage terminase large subunit family protein [Comamonas terrae]|uniref:Phage terminase large subunit family protein n=1 Tax=Comamonas terrae TaxID=673548 RepID=A0ABW5ULP2_9BURK|nr:terminase gpA endonuclease subunit [Comamonas terrae]